MISFLQQHTPSNFIPYLSSYNSNALYDWSAFAAFFFTFFFFDSSPLCIPAQSAYNGATTLFSSESHYNRKSTTSSLVSNLCSLWSFNYSLPAAVCVCCFSHWIPFVNAVLDWMLYRAITDKLLMTYTQAITNGLLISSQRPVHSVHHNQASYTKACTHFPSLNYRLEEWALLEDLHFSFILHTPVHLYVQVKHAHHITFSQRAALPTGCLLQGFFPEPYISVSSLHLGSTAVLSYPLTWFGHHMGTTNLAQVWKTKNYKSCGGAGARSDNP